MGEGRSRHVGEAVVALVAFVVGLGIAWLDTRPTWDDAGITAGSLLLTAGFAAAAGGRWWGAALLVAAPTIVAEASGVGPGVLVALAFTAAGSLLGAAWRRRK